MIATIKDEGVRHVVEFQLQCAGYSWLHVSPIKDVDVKGHTFAIYSTTIYDERVEPRIYDAWIIACGNKSSVYVRENFPNYMSAVAYHIGLLVMQGDLKIVKRKRRS